MNLFEEYGLSFIDGRRIVRYISREAAEHEQQFHPGSKLVVRQVSPWRSYEGSEFYTLGE